MFQYIRNTIRRHSKKLLWTTGIISISYLLSLYIQKKVKEFQEQLQQENATRALIKKRFAQTQKDCYMTFLSFLPALVEPIYTCLNVEQVTGELKLSRRNKGTPSISDDMSSITKSDVVENDLNIDSANKKTKAELWQDLKIKSLTRFLTLIYSESLLIILIHLQLNIISRKSYLNAALKLATSQKTIKDEIDNSLIDNDESIPEQAFLSFTWWLLNKGNLKLVQLIEICIREVFNEVSLRDELGMMEFGSLVNQTQMAIENNLKKDEFYAELYEESGLDEHPKIEKIPKILSLLLPPEGYQLTLLQNTNSLEFLTTFQLQQSNADLLLKLNNELSNYLKSENVHMIVNKLATVGVSSILPKVEQTLMSKHGTKSSDMARTSETTESQPNIASSKWKLALILGVLTPHTQELSSARMDNPILYAMNNISELDSLSASVYSNFDV
ncbi:hypothetical protein CANINC_004029 [Pichia inconspicua]|uniref:Peroxin-3 n=1 Tax=Pichia inconspicua TaxID=52247 RepID=A0A4T0WX81_9ASCO|nr:hypothetical protein CANINC_004029 [[Candida] inconspicua]